MEDKVNQGTVNIYFSKGDFYLLSKPFDIKEHNLWNIQGELVKYLHNNLGFLFQGKGEFRIPDIQLPSSSSIL